MFPHQIFKATCAGWLPGAQHQHLALATLDPAPCPGSAAQRPQKTTIHLPADTQGFLLRAQWPFRCEVCELQHRNQAGFLPPQQCHLTLYKNFWLCQMQINHMVLWHGQGHSISFSVKWLDWFHLLLEHRSATGASCGSSSGCLSDFTRKKGFQHVKLCS